MFRVQSELGPGLERGCPLPVLGSEPPRQSRSVSPVGGP
jgi:hypothetical protein